MKGRRGSEAPEIPMDVVTGEILTRLPAKSVMRFKCVSNLWASLISSRYFSNRFLTVPSARIYMCLVDLRNYRKSVIISSAPDTSSSYFVVDHDLTIPQMGGHIVQNLRGFMCYIFGRKPRIYNPTTRQLVTLPAATKSETNIAPGPGGRIKVISYYFGHDPFNDQYKVVCSIGECSESMEEITSEHWVFVLKAGGSWKKAATTPAGFFPHIPGKRGLCIDGVIYYLGWIDLYRSVLVSFHIRPEEFKMIQVPLRSGHELPRRVRGATLVEYGGKVTILDQTNLRDKGRVDLWVLESAENKEWSRKTLVLQPSQLHLINNTIFNVKGTSQNGKVLLIPADLLSPFNILCYDLQSNDMRKIEIKGIPDHWFNKDKANKRFHVMFMDQSESLLYLET